MKSILLFVLTIMKSVMALLLNGYGPVFNCLNIVQRYLNKQNKAGFAENPILMANTKTLILRGKRTNNNR